MTPDCGFAGYAVPAFMHLRRKQKAETEKPLSRPDVYAFLNGGGDRDTLPASCAEYIDDWDRTQRFMQNGWQ